AGGPRHDLRRPVRGPAAHTLRPGRGGAGVPVAVDLDRRRSLAGDGRDFLTSGAERSSAGPALRGPPKWDRRAGTSLACFGNSRSSCSESVAHGTTRRPPLPFWVPPLRSPAPERPALSQ